MKIGVTGPGGSKKVCFQQSSLLGYGYFPLFSGCGNFPFPPGPGCGKWKLENFHRVLPLENFRFHSGAAMGHGNWKISNGYRSCKMSVSTLAWSWKIEIGKYQCHGLSNLVG